MLGALLRSPIPRLVPLGMVLLALQESVFVELQVFGVVVQLLLAFSATAGAVGGPERGAMTGFIFGIMFDLTTGSPLGSSAITMGAAGSIAGWLDVMRIETTWYLVAVFVTVASAIGELGVPTVRFLIGERDAFVSETWKIVVIVGLTSGIVSIPFAPVARWALGVKRSDWRPEIVKGESSEDDA